jgi:hypothetical protein
MRTTHLVAVAFVGLTPVTLAVAQDRARLPQGPQGTVTLPVGEYNRLVDRAAQPDTTPEPPPIAAVVGRAELRGRVTGQTVRGTLRLDGEVFERGTVKVPLVGGATLTDARMDGRPLPLLYEGGVHVAVLSGPAPFSATLEWAAPVSSSPGRASFPLPAPTAGSISATLDLPGDPAEVRVDGGLVTRKQPAAGTTTVDVTLEPGRRAQVSWSVRETAVQVVPVASRTLADVRSLVTIGEADLRMASLVDLTVVQGEPRTFEVRVPAGYEVTSVTGNTLDAYEARGNAIALTVRDASARRHQFLIGLEQPHAPGSFKVDTAFPTVTGAQREVGEIAIEGIGTIDVTASGDEGLRRMDVRETHAALRSLARQPLLAAFRYQRRAEETRVLTLDVKRFADAPVVAAVAERVTATTLVTTEGRTLTEVVLRLRNRAQPFMKVTLPAGATMLSVEVAGETAKPVIGADGTRVPLLRTGFRPDGVYSVSFVYLSAGEAFAKRGDAQLALPKFDVPVSMLDWELFLPDRYSAKPDGGNVIPARFISPAPPYGVVGGVPGGVVGGVVGGLDVLPPVSPGQIVGRVTDATGGAIPGARVIVAGSDGRAREAVTNGDGVYSVSAVPSGPVTVTGVLSGFAPARRSLNFDQRPRLVDLQLQVGGVSETVEVRSEAPVIDTRTSEQGVTIRPFVGERQTAEPKAAQTQTQQNAPSQNVMNLQRRVTGVLPVRIDVPRTGISYRFVRPLVLDEETTVSFKYKRR